MRKKNLQIFGITLTLIITIFFVLLTLILSTTHIAPTHSDIELPHTELPNNEPVSMSIIVYDEPEPSFVPGQIIIKFTREFTGTSSLGDSGKLKISPTHPLLIDLSEKYNITNIEGISPKPTNPEKIRFFDAVSNNFIITFDKQFDVEKMIKEIESLSIVEKAVPNYYLFLNAVPNYTKLYQMYQRLYPLQKGLFH